MGAEAFEDRISAKTPEEGFRRLVEDARYEHGNGGYTGTIAEKHRFKVETPRSGESPSECVRRCQDDPDHFSDDKWGPAACVDFGPDEKNPGNRIFVFFGWASS